MVDAIYEQVGLVLVIHDVNAHIGLILMVDGVDLLCLHADAHREQGKKE
jgi:hypothetical protein